MNLHFLHLSIKNRRDEPVDSPSVMSQELIYYSNEGSEFLDDAIRTIEQPLMYTEESFAPEA